MRLIYTHPFQRDRVVARCLMDWCLVICLLACAPWVCAETWVEDTFEDFADGTLDASGQNIYISRDGKIRTIHRFDLNDDGWIDLLFNGTHDMWTNSPAVLASVSKARTVQTSKVRVQGSSWVEVADLNRDEYPDLVFTPNPSGIQNPRLFLTIVYGGPDDWPLRRTTGALPVHGEGHYYRGNIVMTAIADLNADDWPDIVTLNRAAWLPNQPAGQISRIYWGGARGFLLSRYRDVGIQAAISVASADLDSDGARDVAFLRSDGFVQILWAGPQTHVGAPFAQTELTMPEGAVACIAAADCTNDGQPDLTVGSNDETLYIIAGRPGRDWHSVKEIQAYPASHIEMGDIDGDSQQDLVLSYFSPHIEDRDKHAGAYCHVLWGDRHGFSRARSSTIDANYVKAAAIGDYDGDGKGDLALAIYQSPQAFTTESIIYFGKANRSFEQAKQGIPTEGASHVVRVPSVDQANDRIVFCNSKGGTTGERIPVRLYWGGPDGFSVTRKIDIPFRSGNGASAADFNADGHVDLLLHNSMHAKQTFANDRYAGGNIFWGNASGLDLFADVGQRRSVLRVKQLGTSNVADLNRDGYLDIVFGQYDVKGEQERVAVYYGSAQGYRPTDRVDLASPGRSTGTVVGDFDKNGWLDIAVNAYRQDVFYIFYGGADGFDVDRRISMDVHRCIDLETADLNADGWLDLIASTYNDAINYHHDTGLFVYWGGPQGFRPTDNQWLPSMTPIGVVVADFDADDFLDLFAPSYHADITRENLPSSLFWGGPQGFDPERRTALIADSGHDGLAADFNKDGKLDLAVVSHTRHDDHRTFSKVFYNDAERFENPRVQKLPTFGAHWSWSKDMGHIYDRSWRQTYISSIFDLPEGTVKIKLSHVADVPLGTALRFDVRVAAGVNQLSDRPWEPVDPSKFTRIHSGARFLQYRATFVSDNGDRYPILAKVIVETGR